jgi:hypothetical protein
VFPPPKHVHEDAQVNSTNMFALNSATAQEMRTNVITNSQYVMDKMYKRISVYGEKL